MALLVYRATLTRYEEDELFLDDASSSRHQANEAVLRKVAKLQPLVRVSIGITCLLTVAIVGFYVWDAVRQFYS
jgi:hypothetical protein